MARVMIQNKILSNYRLAFSGPKTGFAGLWQPRFDEFKTLMKLDGFHMLGRGWYSSVWRCGLTRRVFKINSGQQGNRDGFAHWIHTTRHHAADNPCLPVVGELVADGDRYCIELETLQPLTTFDAYRFGVQIYSDITPYTVAQMADTVPGLADAFRLAWDCIKVCNPDHRLTPSPTLVDIITDLDFSTGAVANLMLRGGQIVINDPIAHSKQPIGPILADLQNGLMQWAA